MIKTGGDSPMENIEEEIYYSFEIGSYIEIFLSNCCPDDPFHTDIWVRQLKHHLTSHA